MIQVKYINGTAHDEESKVSLDFDLNVTNMYMTVSSKSEDYRIKCHGDEKFLQGVAECILMIARFQERCRVQGNVVTNHDVYFGAKKDKE